MLQDRTQSGADIQSELMDLLTGSNVQGRLRSVKREVSFEEVAVEECEKKSNRAFIEAELEQRKLLRMIERENLLIETLSYMETPNGSLEELVDKCEKSSAVSRGFIYTLVRRGWAKGYRLENVENQAAHARKEVKHVPCKVFPGTQFTSCLVIPDERQERLDGIYPKNVYLGKVHMYRFDESMQKHLLDTIVFYTDNAFPPPFQNFTRKEPVQDSSLESRNMWEIWNRKKLDHSQSDSAQYNLIWNKLGSAESKLFSSFNKLEATIMTIREMNATITEEFRLTPLKKLRAIVASIPSRIKQFSQRLHETSGMIIKQTDLKLTPAFMKTLLKSDDEPAVQPDQFIARANNRSSMGSFNKRAANFGRSSMGNMREEFHKN
jgi:hypothetical protein